MSKLTINGKTYTGNNISIINGSVTIDGVAQGDSLAGIVEIKITEGVLNNLRTDASVTCTEVHGNVDAGGSVACYNVGGNVDAGGSVHCAGGVAGNVDAGGSVVTRK